MRQHSTVTRNGRNAYCCSSSIHLPDTGYEEFAVIKSVFGTDRQTPV